MERRFVSIWFRYLKTDRLIRRQPELANKAIVLTAPVHGKMIITDCNFLAEQKNIYPGMALADARAIHPSLEAKDDIKDLAEKLLKGLGEWCIRYTPSVYLDLPSGLILDATGCAHLWGNESDYLNDIKNHLQNFGYTVIMAMADSIGAAWALSHFSGEHITIIEKNKQQAALLPLPAASFRIESLTLEKLHKLGLRRVKDFIAMPRTALRRRFGQSLIKRIDQVLGNEEELLEPVVPIEPYAERLPCFEPILTRTGIEIALQKLLELLCEKLGSEEKGIRACVFKCFRTDARIQSIEIGTNHGSSNQKHLFKLFENKLENIDPGPGIDFFLMEATKVEELSASQEKLWDHDTSLNNIALMELMDRFMGKFGVNRIRRYLPDEHHWPERSIKPASSPDEKPSVSWKLDRPRPLLVLPKPEAIDVTAPIPDYPPMLFRYKGQLHTIKKADGPERIEQEWWIQDGQHRDYYCVEDEKGGRYWLFRLGHYDEQKTPGWFLHGFFA
jgi:protein ImuB